LLFAEMVREPDAEQTVRSTATEIFNYEKSPACSAGDFCCGFDKENQVNSGQ